MRVSSSNVVDPHYQITNCPRVAYINPSTLFLFELIKYTLFMFYKRRLIRDSRQIVEKNKRQGLAFFKKLRDSANWVPEAVDAEFGLEAI